MSKGIDSHKIANYVRFAASHRLMNFSRYVYPYMEFTPFHKVYYHLLDMFAHGRIKKMIIQVAPQHGKSQGSSRLLPAFMLGLNPDLRICIGSYSSDMAMDFNRDVQKIIDTKEYSEIFPETSLNRSNVVTVANNSLRNSRVFEIVGHRGSLRSVGRGGGLTGKTVDVAILDDVYKDYQEGNSPVVREAAWKWYTSVVKSRLHNKSQELIVFTRWHEEDLIGRIAESDERIIDLEKWSDLDGLQPKDWVRINFEAIKTTEPTEIDPRPKGASLWEEMHSLESLQAIQKLDPVMFNCLYQGNPGGAEGRLYHAFKTYVDKGEYGTYVRSGNYTDVADEGSDYLVSLCYDVYQSRQDAWNEKKHKFEPLLFALVTDAIVTQENTELTEQSVPALLNRNNTQRSWIESNNGGSGFEKKVAKRTKCETYPFHQSLNKESRIITNSASVNSQIVFPFDWKERFPKLYEGVTKYLRDFSANAHDDVPDVLTGIYEKELSEADNRPYWKLKRGIIRRN